MIINIVKENDKIVLIPEGLLDTANASEFGESVEKATNETKNLTIDFSKVEYISSSGLRILLKAQKKLNGTGQMVLINVNETVKEVFEITGFSDILTIQ